jgi:hypothetical protein
MKKILLALLLTLNLYSSEIPFDANLRVRSKGDNIIYSTRLNLIEFNQSKIITIFEQEYDTQKNATDNRYYWYYIIKF